ncbi:MAG: dynamin family protein, partial [Acidimicrobiia bacterium]
MPQSAAVVALRDDRWHITGLESLAKAVESMDIGPGAGGLAADRNRIVATLRTYLLPRFEDPHGPLVVVFAGPTGSGKSTLVNSLVGRDMSETGSLRPTTSEPVIVASQPNAPRFETLTGVECEVVIGSAPILGVMALVDTPDIDSTALDHRRKAEALVDRADVVVFVTSALRYADDVAWQVLRRAVSRGADVIHVLNRATSGTSGAVSDFRSLLRSEGLDDVLVTIPEHHLPTGGQQIPSLAVRSLRRRLAAIAARRDTAARSTRDQVLALALRDTQDLLATVAGLDLEVDALAAELSLDLARRAAGLDLTLVPSVAGITPPP